jgi:phosphocarrier protein
VTVERAVQIVNKLGLHARAAAKLVTLAQKFKCDIHLKKDGREVSGKSIMGVMMLAAAKGSRVTFRAEGPDAEKALDAIEALVARKFDEAA